MAASSSRAGRRRAAGAPPGQAKPFDWAALRKYAEYAARSEPLPADENSSRYVRWRRFTVKWARVRDAVAAGKAMIDLAAEMKLDWRRAARLYVKLQHLASNHSFRRKLEGYERAGDAVRDLEDIRNSLAILERFSMRLLGEQAGPREKIAEQKLENAAWFWADTLRRRSEEPGQHERWEEAKAHGFKHHKTPVKTRGFDPDPAGPSWHSYDTYGVVRTWLRNNILFAELTANIISKERGNEGSDEPVGREISSAQLLNGIQLPQLYEQYSGRRYGFSRNKEGQIMMVNGPKFSIMCYPVMDLAAPPLETLRTHRNGVRAQGK